MIVLVSLSIGLIVLLAVVGIIFNNLLFQNSRSQDKVDALAMSLARLINAGNRVGQMNELEDRCRELVYVSRQTETACAMEESGYLAPLCEQLLIDARAGQKLVEAERKNQIRLICREVQDAASRYNRDRGTDTSFSLEWLRTYEPRVTDVALGSIQDVHSSVRCQRVFGELAYNDYIAEFLDPDSGLYYAPLNAKLPGNDGDLDFKLSALPASVNMITPQPRNTNSDVFVPYGKVVESGEQSPNSIRDIPNAVQVSCVMDALVGPRGSNKVSLSVVSTGITTGASPEPED